MILIGKLYYHQVKSINIYKYFTGEEILSPYQSRIISQARFSYSSLGKSV